MYKINDRYYFENRADAKDYIIENIDYQYYNEWLDCDREIEVLGFSYYPSYILENLDPIAYRCGFDDFLYAYADDEIDYWLDRAEKGYSAECFGFDIEFKDDDEDEE